MNEENKGYLLALINDVNKVKAEKVFLNPKKLYIPEIANEEMSFLIKELGRKESINGSTFTVTITNQNNGVSVDKEIESVDALSDPEITSQVIKDLINIIRGYDMDEEINICGW
ncbi:DUF1869 domain-containing protein [Morganella psychrotolerans]|uniref:DUF1869 domain-containing protein n=1 Tax=Morganella psychrotolerans TaxID=368603 RepID=A0A1B8HEE5_9GAMM|nr:DUF1869 domain-containing protein [Morganella psychrotolerans]OBU07458.1 hypothetical protein AYY17_04910 [Morganella psychrotolerans]